MLISIDLVVWGLEEEGNLAESLTLSCTLDGGKKKLKYAVVCERARF